MDHAVLLALRSRVTSHYHPTSTHHTTTYGHSHSGGGTGVWIGIAVIAAILIVMFAVRRMRRSATP